MQNAVLVRMSQPLSQPRGNPSNSLNVTGSREDMASGLADVFGGRLIAPRTQEGAAEQP